MSFYYDEGHPTLSVIQPWAARCIKCQEEFDQAQPLDYREAA